jgi:hypothetical protein
VVGCGGLLVVWCGSAGHSEGVGLVVALLEWYWCDDVVVWCGSGGVVKVVVYLCDGVSGVMMVVWWW